MYKCNFMGYYLYKYSEDSLPSDELILKVKQVSGMPETLVNEYFLRKVKLFNDDDDGVRRA